MMVANIGLLIGILVILAIIAWNIIEERARDKRTELAFKYARRHGLRVKLDFCYFSKFELITISNGYKTKGYSGYDSLLSIIRRIKHDFIEQD